MEQAPIGLSGDQVGRTEEGIEYVYETDKPPVAPEPKDMKISEHLKGPVREEDEIFCDYRCRLWWEKMAMKQYMGGRTIWIGSEKGPAHSTDRMERSNKQRNRRDARKEYIKGVREAQGFTRKTGIVPRAKVMI